MPVRYYILIGLYPVLFLGLCPSTRDLTQSIQERELFPAKPDPACLFQLQELLGIFPL